MQKYLGVAEVKGLQKGKNWFAETAGRLKKQSTKYLTTGLKTAV